jgi:hypothetical protein
MELIIGGTLLLGLCAWILIDAHLLRKKPVKVIPKMPGEPYTVSEIKQARYLLIGLSCVFYAVAVAEWLNLSLPPFTGKGSWLYGMLYYGIGPKAVSVFWALFGMGFFLIALFKKPVARK